MNKNRKIVLTGLAACGLLAAGLAQTQSEPMTFFLTSAGSGNGGDLGGLEGADAICQNLAESVDQGDLTWRAYLSTQGNNSVNARDRIGPGPWFNANGNRIATDVDQLHSVMNRISAEYRSNKRPIASRPRPLEGLFSPLCIPSTPGTSSASVALP